MLLFLSWAEMTHLSAQTPGPSSGILWFWITTLSIGNQIELILMALVPAGADYYHPTVAVISASAIWALIAWALAKVVVRIWFSPSAVVDS